MQKEPGWPLTAREARSPEALGKITSIIKKAKSLTIADSLPARIALVYTVRTVRHLDAVARLCSAGLATEAIGIVRAICEDTVALAYIADSPSTRAAKWATFAEERAAMGARPGTAPTGSAWWSGKSPTVMARGLSAKHAAIRDAFPLYYWRLCDDTHGSPKSAVNYVVGAGDTGDFPEMLVGPSNHRVLETSAVAAAEGLMLFQVAAGLGVGIDVSSMVPYADAIAPHDVNTIPDAGN